MTDLTFYVIDTEQTQRESEEVATMPGRGTELHRFEAVRRWLAPVAKEVPADRLVESFEKAQRAIDAMLAKLSSSAQRGYQLDEFEVSLAVSGEGTIGIVTASAEAGVVLKFKRAQPDTAGASQTT
jgi:hypothetical protein